MCPAGTASKPGGAPRGRSKAYGGTVRELSAAADISERAATTRYRRTPALEQALADTLLALADHERILPDLHARIVPKPLRER